MTRTQLGGCLLFAAALGAFIVLLPMLQQPDGLLELGCQREVLTEADLEAHGGQNALRVSWPVSERSHQLYSVSGWPSAGSAPADGKVKCSLTLSTANRWPKTGAIEMGTIRAAWFVSPSLGWITIQNAGCADLGDGKDACSITFVNMTRSSADNDVTSV